MKLIRCVLWAGALAFLALSVLAFASCENAPFVLTPDGTKISLGQTVGGKSKSKDRKAEITLPDQTKITLEDNSTGEDQTELTKLPLWNAAGQVGKATVDAVK